jgi:hypothetical protein
VRAPVLRVCQLQHLLPVEQVGDDLERLGHLRYNIAAEKVTWMVECQCNVHMRPQTARAATRQRCKMANAACSEVSAHRMGINMLRVLHALLLLLLLVVSSP